MRAQQSPSLELRWLAGFAWSAVCYNVAVILWGALVRATGSGAGCGNHWPLCNGQVIPVSPGFHTIVEFTHRMMTGGAIFVVLALLIWTFRETTPRHPARFFAVASGLLLLNEAFLGALLVKLGYVTTDQSAGRVVVLSVHLSNTLLLLAALTLTARWLGLAAADGLHKQGRSWSGLQRARGFGWAVLGLAATILVGVSGSLAALGDTLFPATSLGDALAQDYAPGSPLLLRLRILHPLSAILAGAFVIWLVVRSRSLLNSTPELNPGSKTRLARSTELANLAIGLLGLQVALGIADMLLLTPAWMQLLHLLGADLYWVALVALAAETIWPSRAEGPASSTDDGRAATAGV